MGINFNYKFSKTLTSLFFIITLTTSSVFAEDELSQGISSNKIGPKDDSSIFTNEFKIIENSFVVNDPKNTIQEDQNIKKLGNFKYELIESNSRARSLYINPTQELKTELKLAISKNGQYFISNGSIFISFEESQNDIDFADDYNLTFVKNYPSMKTALFSISNFDMVNSAIDSIKLDPRVKSVELNLIDPYIKIR